MLYTVARPLLFLLEPEVAHKVTFAALDAAHALTLTQRLATRITPLPVTVMGLRFSNPVGLAAGLDKTAKHIDAIGDLGFGFIEAGTVTPRAQQGNAKPRVFRLPESRAVINRMGFNNDGVESFVESVRRQASYRNRGGILGLNIGKNADTPIESALDDYRICLRRVYEDADYVAVNVSSPNTEGLRSLQDARRLDALLDGLADERRRLEDRHHRRVPLAIKIAPDIADASIPEMVDTFVKYGVDAVIATNTTLMRDGVHDARHAREAGGLSGLPLRRRATEVVHLLSRRLQGALPIIGVGGIMHANDAVEKVQAGASLVQLYTGFIYAGPQLIAQCVDALRISGCVASSPSGPIQQPA